MSVPALKVLVAGLMVGGAGWALAANDGQARVSELLSASPEYRQAWRDVVGKEERLPEWVINLSGSAEQMNAVEEDGDKYLVGPLCETVDYRFLGQPDAGMQALLKEQLRKDPNGH
ncbi:hypothetical protein AWM79_13055 [Pseudomonas agarici]|uniref:Uncharacterized protein n=1 Tax=Pseudomonas agarici TaxID=46677 RepID=A0A0X1T232_PSEAA|nr:Ivy family c-type lysozyme inhibitor [Pseudomonas agarici]AMB86176.1 hypothetical protein AWM79_13055 [Pseudomonas agarici]